jgi:hypothetical protein
MTTNMTLLKRFMDARERSAQKHAQQYLLGLSDLHLEDMGLSRELIKQGPKAWPWHKADEPLAASRMPAAMRDVNTDSGAPSARPAIEQATRFNRPDTETKLAA